MWRFKILFVVNDGIFRLGYNIEEVESYDLLKYTRIEITHRILTCLDIFEVLWFYSVSKVGLSEYSNAYGLQNDRKLLSD